jgi:phosphopantothenoylcysteine decarboxylase/phosphopantothenate--cysteine ligase
MATARVLVGITGGIAAYKACELVRLLVRAGHEVRPVPTPGAERFVSAETFRALARVEGDEGPYPHLRRADLLVVAPLTANTLAKLAHGLADNVLTEAALAHDGPLVLAPAMNPRMWAHPATRANVRLLVDRGAVVVGPAEGELAEGELGVGRMAEPAEIAARVEELLAGEKRSGSLRGRRVVVSAGGTREPLDAVRYVGNRSSGRMGVALAEEARSRGAEVTLIASNLQVAEPAGVEVVQAPTAADVAREALARAAGADVVVMAAAVADYRAAERPAGKRAKDDRPWRVELVPTEDVARALGERKDGTLLVAFGAETGAKGLERKRAMLDDKNADLVVYNDVGRNDVGFESEDNEVTLITRAGERVVARAPKREIAREVFDEIERLLERA